MSEALRLAGTVPEFAPRGARVLPREGPDWLAHAILGLGVLLFAFPVWLALAGSTQQSGAIVRGDLSLLPGAEGLSAYGRVLFRGLQGTQPVWHMLLISGGMALTIALGKIIISLLSAFAVVFFSFPFRRTAFWMIFITLMLPVEVRIIPTYAVMSNLHLISTFTGLTVPLIASATATLLFRQIFAAVPDELVEAARMDGAGPLRFLRDILIPVSAANIAALFVILFVYGWNQYLWPLLVATNSRLDTIIIGIVRMIGVESESDWAGVMATAVLALIPPVVIVVLMQRWFVAGLTEGEK
jgi:sn-glycerol 3-phosphate transport system permease protein